MHGCIWCIFCTEVSAGQTEQLTGIRSERLLRAASLQEQQIKARWMFKYNCMQISGSYCPITASVPSVGIFHAAESDWYLISFSAIMYVFFWYIFLGKLCPRFVAGPLRHFWNYIVAFFSSILPYFFACICVPFPTLVCSGMPLCLPSFLGLPLSLLPAGE